jgi:hypothetical protein
VVYVSRSLGRPLNPAVPGLLLVAISFAGFWYRTDLARLVKTVAAKFRSE